MKTVMKRLIATVGCTVMILGGSAQAKLLGSTPNNNGGRIALDTAQCGEMEGWFMAQSYSNAGVLQGCWTLVDNDKTLLLINWSYGPNKLVPHTYLRDSFNYVGG